jgi:hypothetical protein
MNIPEIKSQYIWVVVFLVFVIPVLVPIGAPFQMSEITIRIYDEINSLGEGDIVVVGGAYVFAFDLESSAALIAAHKVLAENGVRVVNAPFAVEAVQFEKFCIDQARVDEQYGGPWKYGRDYVQLPYMPGAAAAVVAFLEDVQSAVATDVEGTPLSELPLMDDFKNWEDIDLWICPHWSFDMIVRYATAEKGIPAIYFAQAAAYARYSPYMMTYPDKVWMTNGFLGGAQLEKLVGISGLGTAAIDAYAILSAVFVIFFLLGNITEWTREEDE